MLVLLYVCAVGFTVDGMDLPSLSLIQNGNDSSSLVYSKFPGARNVSPTNVNFNAEMDY